jgi:hypothetical protein
LPEHGSKAVFDRLHTSFGKTFLDPVEASKKLSHLFALVVLAEHTGSQSGLRLVQTAK